MLQGSVFVNNKTLAVRLPGQVRIDETVKRVFIGKNAQK